MIELNEFLEQELHVSDGTEIVINKDGTVSAKWLGDISRGSMLQIASESNCEMVNKLNRYELSAVLLAVKAEPFPLGYEYEIYNLCLKQLQEDELPSYIKELEIGVYRASIVEKAGSGINAPVDTYLQVASEGKEFNHIENPNWRYTPQKETLFPIN